MATLRSSSSASTRPGASHLELPFTGAYYCAVLSEHTGYTPEKIHDYLKAKFLPKTIVMADKRGEVAEEITLGRSTTKLNKLDFGDYLRCYPTMGG